MNRKLLVELFLDGMRYPTGKHHLKITRVFEITVHSGQEVVELDEYEDFVAEDEAEPDGRCCCKGHSNGEMFHVGRTVLHLKNGRVTDRPGDGWRKKP